MNTRAKIFIGGHRGVVGSTLVCRLQASGYDKLVVIGVPYSVRQFVEFAVRALNITIAFSGEGDQEIGKVKKVEPMNGEKTSNCTVGETIIAGFVARGCT